MSRPEQRRPRPVLQRRRVHRVLHGPIAAAAARRPDPTSRRGWCSNRRSARCDHGDGTRIMYRTDARGNPMAVTATYFEPYNDWPGHGPRFRDRDDRLSGARHPRSAHVGRSPGQRACSTQAARRCGYRTHRWIRMAPLRSGLLAGRRRRGVGGRAGVVVRPGRFPCRRHVRRRTARRSEGTVPVRRRQRARRRGRIRAQLRHHRVPGVRGGHPGDADAAQEWTCSTRCRTSASRRRSRSSCFGTCSRTSTRTCLRWSTRNRSAACSTCSGSAATNPMRR